MAENDFALRNYLQITQGLKSVYSFCCIYYKTVFKDGLQDREGNELC